MNEERRRLAQQVFDESRAHDQATPDRLERFRNLEPQTAELLAVLIRACGARRVLELGTSNGYSTIWIADAASANGGEVTSVEIDPARGAMARSNLDRAGLGDIVELRTADAGDVLRESPDRSWDLIFLDAERPAYADYLPELVRTLRGGGVLAVDNVLSHEAELIEFTRLVELERELTQTIVPVGAGLRLAVRGAGA